MRSTGPQPPPLQSESGDSRRHQSCRSEGGTTAGEFLKPIMWPIIRSTPDARPGTAPDEKTEMRYPTRASEPAHRRLRSRLLLCTIHQCKHFTMCPRGDGKPCAVYLTGDIRMEWSGRAPALPASNADRGPPQTRSTPASTKSLLHRAAGPYGRSAPCQVYLRKQTTDSPTGMSAKGRYC